MLQASSVEILLTLDDLNKIIASNAAGAVDELQLELATGELVVRHRVAVDRLPMAIPVELRFRIRSVNATTVVAAVEWTNLSLVPGFLKEQALQKAFEPLPGHYENGTFIIDVAEVMDEVPISFSITAVHIRPEGVRILLSDVVAYPFKPGGTAAEVSSALVPVPSTEEAEIPEHQDYYHRFRERVKRFAAEKAPGWVQPLLPWVLAAPDFFVLCVRLARDERVSPWAKVMAAVVVTYFISPVDLIPDILPIVGDVDDLAVALFALEQIAQRIPGDVVQELWPGEGRVLDFVKEGTRLFARVLPEKTLAAIRRLLTRR